MKAWIKTSRGQKQDNSVTVHVLSVSVMLLSVLQIGTHTVDWWDRWRLLSSIVSCQSCLLAFQRWPTTVRQKNSLVLSLRHQFVYLHVFKLRWRSKTYFFPDPAAISGISAGHLWHWQPFNESGAIKPEKRTKVWCSSWSWHLHDRIR